MGKNWGFTLIELMVTIAVLAIIATMAASSFGNMLQRQNLNKSTQDLIATLNQARSDAVIRRQEISIQLQTNSNSTMNADTDQQLNWRPSGGAILRAGSPTQIVLGFTGGVLVDDGGTPSQWVPATNDTTFVICERDGTDTNRRAKTVSISRMGTIQQVVEGVC